MAYNVGLNPVTGRGPQTVDALKIRVLAQESEIEALKESTQSNVISRTFQRAESGTCSYSWTLNAHRPIYLKQSVEDCDTIMTISNITVLSRSGQLNAVDGPLTLYPGTKYAIIAQHGEFVPGDSVLELHDVTSDTVRATVTCNYDPDGEGPITITIFN